MKARHYGILVVLLLIAGQVWYSLRKTRPGDPKPPTAVSDGASLFVPAHPVAPREVASFWIARPGGDPLVRLARSGEDGWRLESLHDAPADGEKVDEFLSTLLLSQRLSSVPDVNPDETGLDDGDGLEVRFLDAAGTELPGIVVGLTPKDDAESTYVKFPGALDFFLVAGDVRGDMGLWRNASDAVPDGKYWLETRILRFEPSRVVRIEAVYPDHDLLFVKDAERGWIYEQAAPGGGWSPEAVDAWLRDLSAFRIADSADPEERGDLGLRSPSHRVSVTLDDGLMKTIALCPNRSGEGMWAESTDFPGRVYHLPEWRFKRYFQRVTSLFPAAAPSFSIEEVRFLDIRRGGESVKLARREGGWRTVALPYPPRSGQVELLIKTLASWRPEDYADFSRRSARPMPGGPLVEVTLSGGEVHQYRLGGRHPLFVWRYVMVDGVTLLAADSAATVLMFPDFADILELGRVFPDFDFDSLELLELTDADGGPFIVFRRDDQGRWFGETVKGVAVLEPVEIDDLIQAPLMWKMAGLPGQETGNEDKNMLFRLRLSGKNNEKSMIVFLPQGRNQPFLADGDQMLLLDRNDFRIWLAVARAVERRIASEEAEAVSEIKAEAGAIAREGSPVDADSLPGGQVDSIDEEEVEKPAEDTEPPHQPAEPDIVFPSPYSDADASSESPSLSEESSASDSADRQPEAAGDIDPEKVAESHPVVLEADAEESVKSSAVMETGSEIVPPATEDEGVPDDSADEAMEDGTEREEEDGSPPPTE